MSQSANRLTCHHRDCDACFAQLENAVDRGDWSTAENAYTRFRDELEAHFSAEKQILFPRFESRTGVTQGSTAVMRHEHDMMRKQLASRAKALEQRDAAYGQLMRAHVKREESCLFPQLDEHFDDNNWLRVHAATSHAGDPLFGDSVAERYRRSHGRIARPAGCDCAV